MANLKGVLLVNLGTPDAPDRSSVYRYLKQFLLDDRVLDVNPIARNLLVRGIIAPFRSGKSAKLYRQLWTAEGSPLKVYGELLTTKVQEELGDDYRVVLAMRYQNPSIEVGIRALLAQQVSEIIIFPLFPQYASASTGSVHEEVMRVLSRVPCIPSLRFVSSYPTLPEMIEVFAQRAAVHLSQPFDHVLFSYHGLPERQILKGDDFNHCVLGECCNSLVPANRLCYRAQCFATTRALVQRLGLQDGSYTTCFQSRLGRTPWLKPYTSEVLEHLAAKGVKSLLVFCPAFSADCLETTVEVSTEYKEEFEKLGGHRVQLVESLNDHPLWVKAVAKLIRNEASPAEQLAV